MARNISPRKKRNKSILNPHQRIISQYFTPRSGISKDEVNFLAKPNPVPRCKNTPGFDEKRGYMDQITLSPALGFTTAAKIYQQAGKWCSEAQTPQTVSVERNLASVTCKPEDFHVPCISTLRNSSTDRKQARIDGYTRVPDFMASSSSSSSSSTTTSDSSASSSPLVQSVKRTRRSITTQNNSKGSSAKKQKSAPAIIISSEDEKSSSDNDCCEIVNVVRGGRIRTKSDSEVEESTSSSQTSCTGSSSQSSQTSKGGSTSSQSESDQSNSVSFKSARRAKKQSSARSTFGLVGGDVIDSDEDDDSQDSSHCGSDFSQLPIEIMENIFCQLPIVDLMLNCALVCRQWYNIISQDSVNTASSYLYIL